MPEKNVVKDYIERAVLLLREMDSTRIEFITSELARCIQSGGKILVCGNGGSASDASHFAGELLGRFRREREAFAALALTTDSAVITAIANDYGYDKIFSRQVEAIGRMGDTLIAISTSGTSPNILRAAEKASEIGLNVIAFTSSSCLSVDWADQHWHSNCLETSHTQEQMFVAFHAICEGLEELLAENK